jgi:hypothetical protein
MKLRKKGKSKLANIKDNFAKAKKHLDNALKEYANVMISDELSDCSCSVFEMLIRIEYVIYTVNNTYIKRGIKRIPKEISRMKLLPVNFMNYYRKIVKCNNIESFKVASTAIIKNVKNYIIGLEIGNKEKQELTSDSLTGTYEEIYSNWKTKMHLASKIDNEYLAFMTMASCQKFYNEMANKHNIPKINLIQKYNPNDLDETARVFDDAMEEWKKLYDKLGKPIRKYEDLDEFKKDYLGDGRNNH